MTVIFKRLITNTQSLQLFFQKIHTVKDIKIIQLFDYKSKYLKSTQISYKLVRKQQLISSSTHQMTYIITEW